MRILIGLVFLLLVSSCGKPAVSVDPAAVIRDYSQIVYLSYKQARTDAESLQKSVDAFVQKPTDSGLEDAKKAWLKARISYGQTEAFRFYEGPIDRPKGGNSFEGPEALLNAWPLNEAYIDSVKGKPQSGIINTPSMAINVATLTGKNQQKDEADVSTGYHAVEFLLWGQDFNDNGPGKRPVTDYTTEKNKERRKQYLQVVTGMIVSDLKKVEEDWAPGKQNYAAEFQKLDPTIALGHILTGLTTLSGFELASERIGDPLKSGDQEDEHSCFSDNTHNDYIYNIKGIRNVYRGEYGDFKGAGIGALIGMKNDGLAKKLESGIDQALKAAENLPPPIDQILKSAAGSPGRKAMQDLMSNLLENAKLLQEAGKELGADAQLKKE